MLSKREDEEIASMRDESSTRSGRKQTARMKPDKGKKPVKDEIEAKIEYQEIIGEARPGSYQPIRFTRVKYKASHETHIDIRQFQRGYGDNDEEEFYPTKRGLDFLRENFAELLRNMF